MQLHDVFRFLDPQQQHSTTVSQEGSNVQLQPPRYQAHNTENNNNLKRSDDTPPRSPEEGNADG